jgi:hypothetical protein
VRAFSISAKIVDTVLLLANSDTALLVVSERAAAEAQIEKAAAITPASLATLIMMNEIE